MSNHTNHESHRETWNLRKPAKLTRNGIVASQHYAASRVGADILSKGGNAVDAAIAASLMIGTVEPWMSGIGGGGYMLYFEAATGRTHSIEFGMRSPIATKTEDYPLVAGKDNDLFAWPSVLDNRNVQGPLSIATPGYLSGLDLALRSFGTRSFADLIDPACESAERGMIVDWYATVKIASAATELSRYPESAKTYLPDGFVPVSTWTGSNPSIQLGKLSQTLRRLQHTGVDDFYHGEIAQKVCADVQAAGGTLSENDLANYNPAPGEADSHAYRDATIYAPPGLSAGPTLRDTLSRMQASWQPGAVNTDDNNWPDAKAYTTYATALTDAYEQRLRTLGDINDAASPGCTTHLSCVDRDGNMVALTQTLLSVFGSRVMLPQTGLLMNNGMMWFDPRPGHPNSIGAGKVPLSNMCPTMFKTANGQRYALGASGGRRIMPAVMQLISFVVDHGMDVDSAMHTPRLDVSGGPTVVIDEKLGDTVADAIAKTHATERVYNTVQPVSFACPNMVSRALNGEQSGAAFINSPWAEVAIA